MMTIEDDLNGLAKSLEEDYGLDGNAEIVRNAITEIRKLRAEVQKKQLRDYRRDINRIGIARNDN